MNIVFRADASITIGTGHVVRCLTLADALRRRGAQCHFICRPDAGHLLDLIRLKGHAVQALACGDGAESDVDWRKDAAQTLNINDELHPDWLIVDHYRLGQEWEDEIRSSARRLFVIDDLGRPHRCDMLLDQNLHNPMHGRYRESLAGDTQLLLGPEFALVRPEFAALRPSALKRRHGSFSRLLISMGGSDPDNETSKVLGGLLLSWDSRWTVDVVIGSSNPNAKYVEVACHRLPNAQLHVQTTKMAELMLAADCAINAGGSTTWERCCLGLPALVTIVSDDQAAIAESVAKAGAQILVGWNTDLTADDYARAIGALTRQQLCDMSAAAAGICDGLGADRVAARLH
jgi:UDP-2,4-diacetamido-2,4,6-trideoxy-beta-L-altropyranose hydrolase